VTGAAELRRVEAALDALLNEIVERTLAQRAEPKMPRAAQLMATPFKAIALDEIPSCDETEVNEILQDPIGAACRYAIKRLGQHLYTMTKSMDVMAEVLNRVAERDPKHSGLRADIMDKWWEGVGAGDDRWWP
jgi:hypothetical protein